MEGEPWPMAPMVQMPATVVFPAMETMGVQRMDAACYYTVRGEQMVVGLVIQGGGCLWCNVLRQHTRAYCNTMLMAHQLPQMTKNQPGSMCPRYAPWP